MNSKNDLDPFRAIIGVLVGMSNSDRLIAAISATGLCFDLLLSSNEAYSHTTRVRAYQPRILAAYDLLDDQSKLCVAKAVLTALSQSQDRSLTRIAEILQKIGWDIRDGELVAIAPDLREMFFPKGSQWDAFVILRDLFASAQTELAVVDPYCDHTLYQLLAASTLTNLKVRILCSKYAATVANEARAFNAQYPTVTIEVRQTRDFHDRFIVIDDQYCINVGASINQAGNKAFMISRVEDQQNRDALIANIEASWKAASVLL